MKAFSQGLFLKAATFAIGAGSEDKKEGSFAFLAKRPPKFLRLEELPTRTTTAMRSYPRR
jgi:hypothetical protein